MHYFKTITGYILLLYIVLVSVKRSVGTSVYLYLNRSFTTAGLKRPSDMRYRQLNVMGCSDEPYISGYWPKEFIPRPAGIKGINDRQVVTVDHNALAR